MPRAGRVADAATAGIKHEVGQRRQRVLDFTPLARSWMTKTFPIVLALLFLWYLNAGDTPRQVPDFKTEAVGKLPRFLHRFVVVGAVYDLGRAENVPVGAYFEKPIRRHFSLLCFRWR